jgi:hypothetical protein
VWNFLRITAAVLLIVGAGIVHGKWTGRWGASPAMAASAARPRSAPATSRLSYWGASHALLERYQSVPMVIGEWKGTPFELDPDVRKRAGAEAWLTRVYTNPARGVSVSVLLLGGRPDKISVHTPDVCYPAAGYDMANPSAYDRRYGPDGRRAGFRTALAVRGGVNPSALRIFWGWHSSTGWSAPEEDPRWTFVSEPTLSKLYVVRETGGAAVEPDRDPCNDFLDVFLPELDRAVFSAAG